MYKRGDQFQQNHSSPVFSTDDIEIGSRENMTDLCVTCTKVVRPRQEAIQCDSCHGWQHSKSVTDLMFMIMVIIKVCMVCKKSGASWNMGPVVPKFPGRVGTWGELSRKPTKSALSTVLS